MGRRGHRHLNDLRSMIPSNSTDLVMCKMFADLTSAPTAIWHRQREREMAEGGTFEEALT